MKNTDNKKSKLLATITYAIVGTAMILFSLYFADILPFGEKISPGETKTAEEPLYGEKITLKEEEIPLLYSSVGTVQSRDEVEISSRIIAKIKDITAREGEPVKKGSLIVSLDDSELKAALAKANEKLNGAKASLDLSEKELARTKSLFEKNATSKKTLDQAESNYQTALATLAASKEAIKEAEAALSYASILSPIDGFVSKRYLDPGDLAIPGIKILQVFDNSRLMLHVPISESLSSKVRLGDKMNFHVDAVNKTYEGELKEISMSVDPQTRNFMVKICLGTAPELLPGMFGSLKLNIGTEKAILIPEKAIIRSGQLEFVTKINDDGSTTRLLVRTAPSSVSGKLKIISGLSSGNSIILPTK